MIDISIKGNVYKVPTDVSEIKLSSYIEFTKHYNDFILKKNSNMDSAAIKDGVAAISCIIDNFEEAAKEIEIGEYSAKSKNNTINGLMYLISSTIITYEPEPLSDAGYRFEYKGKNWMLPYFIDYSGKINPKLSYGQYTEAMETIRVCNSVEEKTLNIQFTEMLRLMASLVREEGYDREETLLSLRTLTDDNALYFSDIDMKTGLDINFFLSGTIHF